MCVGPGSGGAAVTRTDKVAALLEVTLSWELDTTCVLLITNGLYFLITCVVFAVVPYYKHFARINLAQHWD